MKPGATGKFDPGKDLPHVDIVERGALFVVKDGETEKDILYNMFGFGHIVGHVLVLSPYEAFFLGALENDDDDSIDRLWQKCSAKYAPGVFATRYAVYHFYRHNLWIVKDGLTFGGDFVLYKDHPDVFHSTYIVTIRESWDDMNGDIIMASRIAWNVGKMSVFIRVIVPDGTDMTRSSCVGMMSIEDISIKRARLR